MRDVYAGMQRVHAFHNRSTCANGEELQPPVEQLIAQAGIKGINWDEIHKRAELLNEQIELLVIADMQRLNGV
jgi:hypothetical protein